MQNLAKEPSKQQFGSFIFQQVRISTKGIFAAFVCLNSGVSNPELCAERKKERAHKILGLTVFGKAIISATSLGMVQVSRNRTMQMPLRKGHCNIQQISGSACSEMQCFFSLAPTYRLVFCHTSLLIQPIKLILIIFSSV